jgi:succinylglutamic semialdehyde dehydrogenase
MTANQPKLISRNPINGEILWEGTESGENEVKRAIAAAKQALPNWSLLTRDEREAFIKKFGKELENKKEMFAEAISKETGKPLWESKTEVSAMLAKIDISIEAQKQRCPEPSKKLPHGNSITRHKPIGVVAVFGPFNFPGHLPNGHIIPALLAGNTVIFKPSELTPYVGQLIYELWNKAGLPQNVINIVQGGPGTGKFLSQDPDINGLFFTGSWKTGKMLAEQFGKNPDKLLTLEMGGNNPLVIGNISNLEAAAYLIIQSSFITAGQRCTCARRLIVQNDATGKSLIKLLVDMTSRIKVGPYTDLPEPFMGPLISNHAANHMLTVEKSFVTLGANPLLPLKELKPNTPLLSPGIIDVTGISRVTDEEHFGPLLQVIRVNSFDEAIKEANHTAYGLVAGIFSDDKTQYEKFYKLSRAGVINWNAQTTGASSTAPFGGVGQSGNYRPSAFYAADYCNYPVASIEVETLTIPEKTTPGIQL